MHYEIHPITSGCWAIQDGNVRMYLLDGGTDAVLIDTGYGSGDLKAKAASLCGGTIHVINTHSHSDHISGNRQFSHFFMGKEDAPAILPVCPPGAHIETVADGAVIRLGTLALEVIETPGHTPGAISLLDRERRLLFSGDTFAKLFPIYMQYPGQDLHQYLRSMRKLQAREAEFDRICPAHGELRIEKAYMKKTIRCCEGIINRSIKAGSAQLADGGMDRAYWFEDVAIFC